MSDAPVIAPPSGAADWAELRRLLVAYADSLSFSLAFQCFGDELEGLPGDYAPPGGGAWLATLSGRAVGCVALRRFAPTTAELKRLYVAPEGRGQGLGRRLVLAALDGAAGLGYARVRLDTVGSMQAANRLYANLGFAPIAAYRHNPLPDARYFEWTLQPPGSADGSTP